MRHVRKGVAAMIAPFVKWLLFTAIAFVALCLLKDNDREDAPGGVR